MDQSLIARLESMYVPDVGPQDVPDGNSQTFPPVPPDENAPAAQVGDASNRLYPVVMLPELETLTWVAA